jgi:hypothetical protein
LWISLSEYLAARSRKPQLTSGTGSFKTASAFAGTKFDKLCKSSKLSTGAERILSFAAVFETSISLNRPSIFLK